MTTHTDTSEKGFQKLITKELVEKCSYVETFSNDFDRDFCINRASLFAFLKESQPVVYDFIMKKGEYAFLDRLDQKIKKDGLVEVLRKGVKFFDKRVDLFFPEPNSPYNIKDKKRFEANIFSVTQELVYSDNHANRIDLVIFLNGFPIITMELKNAFTNQAVVNAIVQYKNSRSTSDKIFNFGRCLVHFAADTDLVYMTTKIEGKKTHFMPFNKGQNDGAPYPPFGAGNPVNPTGLKTAYLWEEILTKRSLANILEKYVHFEKGISGNRSKKEALVFPRYHQLDVVRKLLVDSKRKGIGQRFLIQHSAGSGKSNSITWLAHQLYGLHDEDNHSIFDCVVVVTDRTVLDRQIRENIKNFAQVRRVVEAITGNSTDIRNLDPSEQAFSKTAHMRLALENNKKVIICTVQTFPFVLEAVHQMQSKRIAFIIDEAHSSQSGTASASMNALFSGAELPDMERNEDGEIDTEELVNYLIESRKMLKNASYYAFTATPKNKTLETFGIRQVDGSFKPFHTYSMKQAIEEEYILDVLQNYTTYKSYYKIKSESEAFVEKEFETSEATKKLKSFVEGNELAIYEKAKIMIDHFNTNVVHLINGKAKAMVVTKSIQSAMKYKDAFDRYLSETGLTYKAIVAFSGSKRHYKSGLEMTERSMNDFPDNDHDIPRKFEKDDYKFLIVANKFQTGFDQPLLHTMYVDKQLAGVQAVQTLSRLNRCYKPYKKDTMVLDFYNDVDEIKDAFEPYYTTTVLSEETDVNKLNDLQDDLDVIQVYSPEDVNAFFKFYYSKNRSQLEVLINRCADCFQKDLEKEIQVLFKSNAKNFVRTYGYLSKIMAYSDDYWEKLWLFLKHLIPKLRIADEENGENILEDIDMDSYRINRIGTTKVSLEVNEGIIDPIPVSSTGSFTEKHYDTLENIISEFNQRFGNINWGSDVDKVEVEKILVEKIPGELKQNLDLLKSIKNSDKENAKITSDEKVMKLMQNLVFTHSGLYRKFCSDQNFKKRYQEFVFDILFDVSQENNGTV